jgi:glycine hydroxymethyltransferase
MATTSLSQGMNPACDSSKLAELSVLDCQLAQAIASEYTRQQTSIELIASENFTSAAVLKAQGSILTNKYAEGYPGHRYYGGCLYVDVVETLAIERAKALFSCGFANVQPHSGSQANQAVFLAFLKPGDCILGMDLAAGGHLTHGASVSLSGKWFTIHSYGVDPETHLIDMDKVRALAQQHRPKLIIAGTSAYPRQIDFQAFGEIAAEVGAVLLADVAHIAGLIAAGLHPSPFPHAHVVTTTTHKTLRGPRGGMILWNDPDLTRPLNSAVFPGLQGGPLMHVIAGKAAAFYEALQPDFVAYSRQVIANARALGQGLVQHGFKLLTGGTDTHLVVVDLRDRGFSGAQVQSWLEEVGITGNKNAVPGDLRRYQDTSGLRLGTPAMTTRGFGQAQMAQVAEWIAQQINRRALDPAGPELDEQSQALRKQVAELCLAYPLPSGPTS